MERRKIAFFVLFIIGALTVIKGLLDLFTNLSSPDITTHLTIVIGAITIVYSLSFVQFEITYTYRKSVLFFYGIATILAIGFFIIRFTSLWTIDNVILFSFIYFELIGVAFWVFIVDYAVRNKNRFKTAHVFAFITSISAFLASIFLTLYITKASIIGWRMDLDVYIYMILFIFGYVTTIFSAFLHFVRRIG